MNCAIKPKHLLLAVESAPALTCYFKIVASVWGANRDFLQWNQESKPILDKFCLLAKKFLEKPWFGMMEWKVSFYV